MSNERFIIRRPDVDFSLKTKHFKTSGPDIVNITNVENLLVRTYSGDDTIVTGNFSDYISPGLGNDTVFSHGGDNIILARNGNDKLDGGDGNDQIHGGFGNDTIYVYAQPSVTSTSKPTSWRRCRSRLRTSRRRLTPSSAACHELH